MKQAGLSANVASYTAEMLVQGVMVEEALRGTVNEATAAFNGDIRAAFHLPIALASAVIAMKDFSYCFPAGTVVGTEAGLRPIETVRQRERVWAFDLVKGEWRLCEVLETYCHLYEGELVAVRVAGETLESTWHHPWWVIAGEGLAERPLPDHVPEPPCDATVPGRWVDAGDLQEGDLLLLRDGGRAAIESLGCRESSELVYNFAVAELACYAVGGVQALVHNNSGEGAQRGRVTGFKQILEKARAARHGDIHALGEIEAAKVLREEGRNVHFQTPTGPRGLGGTVDFLVDGVPWDVLTPETKTPDNVISGIYGKESQTPNVILNLRHTTVEAAQLGDILTRVNNFHPDFPGRIQSVRVIE